MPLAASTLVGPYEVVSILGSGSMGEVYLARDSRLNRNVALKIIHTGSSDDAVRQRRFTVEARAASALNHPNIITVHDFGSSDGISYIVSELVDGESLRALVQRGPVAIRTLLEIACQIADGLAAAHAAGIVHRDLKPENVMLTRDQRVKILDFGLAKPVLPDTQEDTMDTMGEHGAVRTQPGLIVGTVGYMSPEQARGEEVSVQSDQFSFGLLLHEMASGHPAFRGETPMRTLLAIASAERAPFTPGPVSFRLLVEKLLSKDPNQRFASSSEVGIRLRRVLDTLPSLNPPEVDEEGSGMSILTPVLLPDILPDQEIDEARPRRFGIALLLGLLAVFGCGLLASHGQSRVARLNISSLRFAPIDTGLTAMYPALSPAGDQVAYSGLRDGVFQIFVGTLQLTKGVADCRLPMWSADGRRVFYVADGKLWSMSVLGGSPDRVADGVVSADISPDGQDIAVVRKGEIATVNHGTLRVMEGASQIRFSPDGRRVAVSDHEGLWVISLNDKKATLAVRESNTQGLSWMPDGERILYGTDHLWSVDLRTGERTQWTAGTGHENWPAVSRDGKRAVFSNAAFGYGLSAVPSDGVRLPFGGAWAVWAPSGAEYAYANGNSILVHDAKTDWQRVLVAAASGPVSGLAFSRDGSRLAFVAAGSVWMTAVSAGSPVLLAKGNWPTWSPDGNWIAFVSGHDLKKARVGTESGPILLKKEVEAAPKWSPDGDWILSNGELISPDGARTKPSGVQDAVGADWSADGRLVALAKADRGFTSPPSPFGHPIGAVSLSPDGSVFLVTLRKGSSGIWNLTGF